jgi:hypothetical protein
MLWWIVDHATVFYLLLGLTALALGAIFWSTRRGGYLLAAGAALALIALVWLLTTIVITDRRQLYLNVQAMARGVEQGDPDKVFVHFSPEFRHGDQDLKSSRDRVTRAIRLKRVSDIHVWSFETEKLSREEKKARVTFLVRFFADGARHLYRCRLDFGFEDGHWRLRGFQVFNPLVNNEQPIQIPM